MPTTPHPNLPALLERHRWLAEQAANPTLSRGERLQLRLHCLDLAAELEQAAAALRGGMRRRAADRARDCRAIARALVVMVRVAEVAA